MLTYGGYLVNTLGNSIRVMGEYVDVPPMLMDTFQSDPTTVMQSLSNTMLTAELHDDDDYSALNDSDLQFVSSNDPPSVPSNPTGGVAPVDPVLQARLEAERLLRVAADEAAREAEILARLRANQPPSLPSNQIRQNALDLERVGERIIQSADAEVERWFAAREAALRNVVPQPPTTPPCPNIPRPFRALTPQQMTEHIQLRQILLGETLQEATAATLAMPVTLTEAELAAMMAQRQAAIQAEMAAAAAVSRFAAMLRGAGIIIGVVVTAVQLRDSIQTWGSLNQVDIAVDAFMQRAQQIGSVGRLDAATCSALKDEMLAMFRAVQLLEERYGQLLPNGGMGRDGQPTPVFRRRFDRIFEQMQANNRRLRDDCAGLENQARIDATLNPCTGAYIIAIQGTLTELRRIRSGLWSGPSSIGRDLESLIGESLDRMNAALQQYQRDIMNGVLTPAQARQQIQRIIDVLNDPNAPLNRALAEIRSRPFSLERALTEDTLVRFQSQFGRTFSGTRTAMLACPPPIVPCPIINPPPPPGS